MIRGTFLTVWEAVPTIQTKSVYQRLTSAGTLVAVESSEKVWEMIFIPNPVAAARAKEI